MVYIMPTNTLIYFDFDYFSLISSSLLIIKLDLFP